MLIVGDYPYKQDIDSEARVDSIEIIVAPDKKKELFEKLNIKAIGGMTLEKDVTLYTQQNGTKYVIIEATNAYLMLFLKYNFASSTLRVATPAVNYAFLWYITRMRFYDMGTWFKITTQVANLKPYFYKSYITRKKQHVLLSCGQKLATKYFSNASYIAKPYEPLGALKYDNYDILAAVGSKLSPYKRVSVQTDKGTFWNSKIYKNFCEQEKKVFALEMIYLHIINEYFIPQKEMGSPYPTILKWDKLFRQSIMDICTYPNPENDFIKEYLMENLDTLIISFRPQLLSNFIASEQLKEITPKPSWNYGTL